MSARRLRGENAGLPLSTEKGWRAKRLAWRGECRALFCQFPEFKDNGIVYDYGLVRTAKVEYVDGNLGMKIAIGKRVGKALFKRGYRLLGSGLYETDRFRVELCFTPTRAVLRISCRRVDPRED